MAETAVAVAERPPSKLDELDAIWATPAPEATATPSPTPSRLDELDAIWQETQEEPTPAAPEVESPVPAPSVGRPLASAPRVGSKLDELEAIWSETPATDAAMKVTKSTVDLATPNYDLPTEAPLTPDQAEAGFLELYSHDVASNFTSSVAGLFRGAADLPTVPKKQKEILMQVSDAVESYRTEKLLPAYQRQYGVTPEALASTKGQVAGAAATVTDIAAGPAVMITKMAAQTYNEGFNAGVEAARAKGVKDPKQLRHAGQVQARTHVAIMAPVLVAYGFGGQLAGKAVEKLAPAAGPALRGTLGTVASSLANLGVSAGARLAEGGALVGDLKQNLVDVFFGVHAGAHAALKTKGVTDAAKVKSTGAKVGGDKGTRVDGGPPLHERAKEPAGKSERKEEVRPSEEAEKAPDVSDVSLTPNDLGTALLDVKGKLLERSPLGEAQPHTELRDQAIAKVGEENVEAVMKIFKDFDDDATHIFMYGDGKRLNREQAGKALGLDEKLDSDKLIKLQAAPAGGKKHVLVQDKVYSGETIEEAREKARAELGAEKVEDLVPEPDYREMTDAELKEHEAVSKVKAKRSAEQEAALEEAKRIDEERAAKEAKASEKAKTEFEREQNREEARQNWEANPIVRSIIDDSGGILSKSEYKKRVDAATFKENADLYEGAPDFGKNNPMHNQIYSKSGRSPDQVVADLQSEENPLLPPDAKVGDMWQILRDLSEKSAEAIGRNKRVDVVDPKDYIAHIASVTHVFEHGAMGAEKAGVLQSGRKPVRLANEDMDAAAIARGLEPRVRPMRVEHGIAWDTAMSRIDADYTAPGRLVDEINAGEKESTSRVEQAMLLHEYLRLSNDRQMEAERAQDRNESADLRKQAREKVRAADDRIQEVHAAIAIAGTETGRTLAFRQQWVFDDYTLPVAMERAERKKGDELSPQEKQDVREGVDKVEKTNREWQKATDEQSRQDALETLGKLLKEHLAGMGEVKKGKTLREGLHSLRDKARIRAAKRLKEGRLFSGVPDPQAIIDATIIGASHIADGLAKAGKITKEWTNAMVSDLGEKVRPFLDQIFNLAKDYHETARRTRDQEQAGKARETKKKRKPTPLEEAEAAAEEGGGVTRRHVFELVDEYVKAGMTELEPIMREVTKDLQESFPGITEREVRDLFTEYGKVRFPSPEQDARTKRELRRQGQLVSAIEDTAEFKRAKEAGEETKGLGPKPSGSKRDIPSQTVRGLTRQLKEDMRAAGFESGDSEAKLKGTHDAIKRGLRNRIEDLTTAITERKRIVAEQKTKITRDDIEIQLTKVRDALQKEYNKIFKKRGLTEDEIIAKAVKFQATKLRRMNDMIDTALAKLSVGDVKARKRGVKMDRPLPPELEAAKQELEKVNKLISEAREALKPPPKSALQKYKEYLVKKTAEVRARIAAKNYTKPTRKKTELDNEALRKKADYTLAMRELDARMEKMKLDAQHIALKAWRGVQEGARFSRSLVTGFDLSAIGSQGGMYTMAHPIRASKIIPDMLRAMSRPTARDFVRFFRHPIRVVKDVGARGRQFQQMIEEEIHSRPNYPLMVEAKLFLGSPTELTRMEEVIQGNLQMHTPGVAASGRAFSSFLMRMRADAFDMMVASLPHGRKPTVKEAKGIANFINVTSGRSSIGGEGKKGFFAGVARELNGVAFAPLLAYSRFETILGQPIWGKAGREAGPAVQRMIAGEYARSLMGGAVVISLLLLAGGTLAEIDWRSSDNGKVRFGNTRVDVFWGLLPATAFLSRLFGKTRQVSKIRHTRGEDLGPFADLRPERRGKVKSYPLGLNILTFGRNKLAPIWGAMWDAQEIMTGRKTPPGHGKTLSEVGLKLTVPINPGDIYDAMQDLGVAKGTALGMIGTLGGRLATYEENQESGDAGLPKIRKGGGSKRISP